MLNKLLASFYERDLRKLIEEVNLFKNEATLWSTQGTLSETLQVISCCILLEA
ncbi:MAG: hypothetical protein JWR54_3062 [Mucilaginibacter sp.]|nr:hypothetical protein [Mucilaginibacter sp.]